MKMNSEEDTITVGCQVEAILTDRNGMKEHINVIIVPDDSADYNHGLLSENTPMAKALLGEKVGHVVPYLKGDIVSIEIVSSRKPITIPEMDAAKKRKAKFLETRREVEDTNAIVFASSFSGKWGDYDPDSIPKEKKIEENKEEDT